MKIYIYGASGHGLVVADIARALGFEPIFIDDDKSKGFDGFESADNALPMALGVGDNLIRSKLYDKAKNAGFSLASLIHPSAVVSPSAAIGDGAVVMPNATINAKAVVGSGAIINSGAVIEHECEIGEFAHISPNVALAGGVKVGDFTHIGIASCAIQGVKIGSNCLIGAGSVVVRNIPDRSKAYGNPCRTRIVINTENFKFSRELANKR